MTPKDAIRDDVGKVLRLTRLLLRPGTDAEAVGKELQAVLVPLAARIRAMPNPEEVRAAFDELILEDMRK